MALGIKREMRITVEPLHNIFSPRLQELPGRVADAPGRRTGVHKEQA